MFKWTLIITSLVISHEIAAFSSDEITAAWVKANLPVSKRHQKKLNLDPGLPVPSGGDDAKVGGSNTSNKPTKKTLNLDPYNHNTQNKEGSTTTVRSIKPIEQDEVQNCTTASNERGICVLYYLCDQSNQVITDGSLLLDIRSGDSDCVHYLETCCKGGDLIRNEDLPEKSKNRPFRTMADTLTPVHIVTTEDTGGAATEECGWNNPLITVNEAAGQGKLPGKGFAAYGDFPWMVAIMKRSDEDVWVQGDYIGGGSLIHPQVVVTAYHKVLKVTAEQIKCRAGEWDTQTENEQYDIQEINARKIVKHEEFFLTSLYNDIALVFLESPFNLADAPHIGTVCVSRQMPAHGKPCFSMGWGRQPNKKIYVNILKKVRLPLVGADICQEQLRQTRLTDHFILDSSLTCAGGEEGIDICTGDGGSSLVCPVTTSNGRTRYEMVGMSAYGMGCGVKDVPGVYANIPHLSDWVDRQMAAEGFDRTTYSYN